MCVPASGVAILAGVHTSTTLPADLARRLTTLGDTLARVSAQIEFAYLFGSAAAGRLTPRSDVDLAIHVAKEADGHALRLATLVAATKHLGTDAVDVVLLNAAPIAVAGRVLTSRQVLLDRAPLTRHLYESVTVRLFQDFRIHEHRLLAARYARG